jgi:hypothetical protein
VHGLFFVLVLGSQPVASPLSLTVLPKRAVVPYKKGLFDHDDSFIATLTNVSKRPVRVATNPHAVGARSLRVDGRDIEPEKFIINWDEPFCDSFQETKQLAPGASVQLRVLGLSQEGDESGHSFTPPGPGRYEIVFEYSFYCDTAYADLVHGPVLSKSVVVRVTR